MNIFRAMNEYNMDDYKDDAKNRIEPQNQATTASNDLSSIIPHIKNGSSSNSKDCWISACKDIKVCISEYALPQRGGFCTAQARKDIAVIKIASPQNLTIKDNYTIYFDENNQVIPDSFLFQLPRPADIPAGTRNGKENKHKQVDNQIQLFLKSLRQHRIVAKREKK